MTEVISTKPAHLKNQVWNPVLGRKGVPIPQGLGAWGVALPKETCVMDYASLKPGQALTPRKVVFTSEAVDQYRRAVEDASELYAHSPLVPPTAVAALGLRGIIEELSIPGGTLHAGQELEFLRAVEVGQELTCQATVSQNAVRGQWRFLTVDFSLQDEGGWPVLRGRSTILLPVQTPRVS